MKKKRSQSSEKRGERSTCASSSPPSSQKLTVRSVMLMAMVAVAPCSIFQVRGRYFPRLYMPWKLPWWQEQKQMLLLFWKEYWLFFWELQNTPNEQWFFPIIFILSWKWPSRGRGSRKQSWQQSQCRLVICCPLIANFVQYMHCPSIAKGRAVGLSDETYCGEILLLSCVYCFFTICSFGFLRELSIFMFFLSFFRSLVSLVSCSSTFTSLNPRMMSLSSALSLCTS